MLWYRVQCVGARRATFLNNIRYVNRNDHEGTRRGLSLRGGMPEKERKIKIFSFSRPSSLFSLSRAGRALRAGASRYPKGRPFAEEKETVLSVLRPLGLSPDPVGQAPMDHPAEQQRHKMIPLTRAISERVDWQRDPAFLKCRQGLAPKFEAFASG